MPAPTATSTCQRSRVRLLLRSNARAPMQASCASSMSAATMRVRRRFGRFSCTIASAPYEMWYVANRYRALTRDPHEACEVLYEIERASRLHVTAIVANSHLMDDTDEDAISQSLPFAREVACAAGLPLAAVCVPASCGGRSEGAAFPRGRRRGALSNEIPIGKRRGATDSQEGGG